MKSSLFALALLFICSHLADAQRGPFYCHTTKRCNFKLHRREGFHVDTSLVRVDGIYLLKTITNGTLVYSFKRFFENGKCFSSCTYESMPNEEDLNDLTYGSKGVYIVRGNQLIAEMSENIAGYVVYTLDIAGNELELNSFHPRSSKRDVRNELHGLQSGVFIKANVYSQPDW